MINRDVAINALRTISALTEDIEIAIRNWPDSENEDLKKLIVLQERNRHVFKLSQLVINPKSWNAAVQQEVRRFLIEEIEREDGLLKQKFGCLYVSGFFPYASWQLTFRKLLTEIVEVREGVVLWSDLYAFDALGPDAYATYQTII